MKNKKIIIPVIIFATLVIGFFSFKYIEAENIKKDISNIKTEIANLIIDKDSINYLKNKKLISDEQVNILDQANNTIKSTKIDTSYLNSLKETKTKLDDLNKSLLTSLEKTVKDSQAILVKDLNNLKNLNSSEKKTQETQLKAIKELKLENSIKALVNSLKSLETTRNDYNKLSKTIKDRLLKEELAKAQSAASSNNGYSSNNTYYPSSSSSNSVSKPSAKPSAPSNSGCSWNNPQACDWSSNPNDGGEVKF